MKKIIGIFTVLFATVAMTFGQTTIQDGAQTVGFFLNGDTDGLTVGWNKESKTIVITYDVPVTVVSIDSEGENGLGDITSTTHKSIGDNGHYSTVLVYNDWGGGLFTDNYVITASDFDIPQFTTTDTTTAFNNGVASVDTDAFYTNGWNDGVASVVCDFNEQDTINAFNNGVASVDTSVYFYNGLLSVNLDSVFQAGVDYGQSTTNVVDFVIDNTLNVYPNPVTQGDNVTIECFDFNKVDVYNTVGQLVHTSTSTSLSTSNLEKGLYVLVISNFDGNVVVDSNNKTAKLLVR